MTNSRIFKQGETQGSLDHHCDKNGKHSEVFRDNARKTQEPIKRTVTNARSI